MGPGLPPKPLESVVTNRLNFKCQVQALFRKMGYVGRLLIKSPSYTAATVCMVSVQLIQY